MKRKDANRIVQAMIGSDEQLRKQALVAALRGETLRPPADKERQQMALRLQGALALHDRQRAEALEGVKKSAKRRSRVAEKWHSEARKAARARLRDGENRKTVIAALATQFGRSEATVRDVLKGLKVR